jgi:multidrug efflux pump
VIVEFNTDVEVNVAKQKVKDEVDKAKQDLPDDLPNDPNVIEIDLSQMPIMNVNLSGNYDLVTLKKYAEDIQDRIESMKEITRVDIVGALDREVKIDVDQYKMSAASVTFDDIQRAVAYENMTISGGLLSVDGMKRSLNVKGEFTDPKQVENIVIRSMSGATIFLKDIANVESGFKEKESYARLDGKNVITLNVIKRSGQNLIDASDKIKVILDDLQANTFPSDLKISVTADQSENTRVTLHDLINTIIIGFILVTLILMFFMGATNAIFVGLSVPLSCFIAFLILPSMGFTMNMIVLFSFLLALGIVVDDAIVVIENTHRVFDNGKVPIDKAAKWAAGEVFLPVLSGTLTTLAPFLPLLFWPGTIGSFMFYLPMTLIITLMASLLVAYIMNPVFAVDFMKEEEHHAEVKITKGFIITGVIFLALSLIFYVTGLFGMGNFTIFLFLVYALYKFVLLKAIHSFQTDVWPRFQSWYAEKLQWFLDRPGTSLGILLALFVFAIIFTGIRQPKVGFFPQSEPNFVYTYISLPVGTDQVYTNKVSEVVEKRIMDVVGEDNPMVQSIITNVAVGAGDPRSGDNSVQSHLAKVTVAFVEFSKRNGESTAVYLTKIREAVRGIPGAEITVEQEQNGPPTGKPINVEILADDFDDLVNTSAQLKRFLDSLAIPGVEELKSDFQSNKPEIVIEIDRERANREGISTAQIGMGLRTALFGLEVSKFKDANDDYPIQLRLKEDQRNNVENLMNFIITYRDMNMGGQIRQVPLSAVATVKYSNTYGGIKRKNQKRIVQLQSNVLNGYNANEVVAKITASLAKFQKPANVEILMTGEQEEQAETAAFLGSALMVSIALMLVILVTQFNSISKPLLILSEIIFSIIGVLIGFSLFKMEISIVMTGIGIIALGGIVVRNGILLVEFADLLRSQGVPLEEAVIEAGRTRMTPVILTAFATVMGLIPLAVGLNIDFVTLFTELNPHIFFGGDNVAFWGPLSWTMIFGLLFGTFLTLIMVPTFYLSLERLKHRLLPDKYPL